MDLLDFARGPVLVLAVLVFVLGVAWRLGGVLRRPRRPDLSSAREGAPPPWRGALRHTLLGLWPRKTFGAGALLSSINGYVFHIGLALVVFGYAPHIGFVDRFTGLSWRAFPDGVIYVAAGITAIALLLALALRLLDPVRRRISLADDWITWTITFLPLATGTVMVLALDYGYYRGPLAVHLLALELLLIWFPFGKLMHAVLFAFSRGATGMRFSHRGVRL